MLTEARVLPSRRGKSTLNNQLWAKRSQKQHAQKNTQNSSKTGCYHTSTLKPPQKEKTTSESNRTNKYRGDLTLTCVSVCWQENNYLVNPCNLRVDLFNIVTNWIWQTPELCEGPSVNKIKQKASFEWNSPTKMYCKICHDTLSYLKRCCQIRQPLGQILVTLTKRVSMRRSSNKHAFICLTLNWHITENVDSTKATQPCFGKSVRLKIPSEYLAISQLQQASNCIKLLTVTHCDSSVQIIM